MALIQPALFRYPQQRKANLRIQLGAVIALALLLFPRILQAASEDASRDQVLKHQLEHQSKRVIVLVPGITGAALRDRENGEVVWGNGARLLSPRDGGHGLAPTIAPSDDPPRLEAFRVIEEIRLLKGFSRPVYGPIIQSFVERGYRHGQLHSAAEGEDFFTFVYDWRFNNELAVQQLYEQLENLHQLRGEERLEVSLICQSNGAHICRYLAKYGNASFDEAEAGRARPPSWLDIHQMVLVGTSNGGGLRILRELDRGRRYVPVIGRQMQPETLFSFPALFQDLPTYRQHWFLSANGEELDLDLFDAQVWKTYGISIFSQRAMRRISRSRHRETFGTEKQRLEYLDRVLRQAQRLQALLANDVPRFGNIRYDLIQNRVIPTPERVVLVEKKGKAGGWKLLFTGDPDLDKDPQLRRRATALGDGHATVTSQDWLSSQEKMRIPCETFYVRGTHFTLILNPATTKRLVDLLTTPDRDLKCPGGEVG